MMIWPRSSKLEEQRSLRSLLVGTMFLLAVAVSAQAAQHPVPLDRSVDSAKCLECHADKSKGKHVHSAIAMGCTTCHDVATAKGVTLINLVSPPNALCFTCHEKSNDKVLHGPYSQGLCVACHSPHASDYPDQLVAAPQDLCLGCHARSRLKIDQRAQTVTTPWGFVLTAAQMEGWQSLELNQSLTANHPIAGHPVSGPNTALGKGEITCLSCHEPHHSNKPNLLPSKEGKGTALSREAGYPTALCDSCHNPANL